MGQMIIRGTERTEPGLDLIDSADFDLSEAIKKASGMEEIESLIRGRKKSDVLHACRHMVLADNEIVEMALDIGIYQQNAGLVRWATKKILWLDWTSRGLRSKAKRALRSLE